ncbi:MAG TPA: SDR family oxidoreductase [Clostridiaceae bacterium]|jgi:NAD(P)-dependent dehydrogenase (short-subunit alcohol dehydrogenase family)|nr:SDR family oxidoreductase [Clostridiaceae bacterium]
MTNKVALVTGSSHGIGYATALKLAEEGYDVGITFRNRRDGAVELSELIKKLGRKSLLLKVDISDLDQIDTMFNVFMNEFGRIDLLVNNAGVGLTAHFLETTPQIFEETINTDFRGAYFCSQRAAKEMIANHHGGVIINVSSNHADGCWPDCSVYAATKAALTKFSKNCAMELAPFGIRVNTVQPGYTETGWGEGNPIYAALERIPFKRFATPEEIADSIVFLASDKAAYITGATLNVDAGALLACVPENMFV